jgi:hypothetical protein
MSKKMNFERHFGSGVSIISTNFKYDAEADKQQRRDNNRIAAIMRNMPLHKRELIHYEVAKKGQATKLKRTNSVAIREERREAEEKMEEAVRAAVDLLEFHMNDLVNTRSMGNDRGLVRQATIHDAIYMLRHKCGVTFQNETEYDHRYQKPHVVPMGMPDETDEEMRRRDQAEARRQHRRELAEKFAAQRQKGEEPNDG